MGALFTFTCPGCAYEAGVSGRKDRGMLSVVETRVCSECRIVVDVLIGAYGREGETGDPEMDRRLGLCPECSAPLSTPWPESRPCPKCGQSMMPGDDHILWD